MPPLSQLLSFLGAQQAHLLRCAMCLFWGADLWLQPSQWRSTVQNPKKSWLATGPACSLVEDASLGPRLPLSGSGFLTPQPPACLLWGMGPVHSLLALLWYLLSPLFCERAWQCLRLALFAGYFSLSFSFFPLSLWLSHSLGCYLRLVPSDCPQGIWAGLYPKQCSPCLPIQPRLLVVAVSTGSCH